MLQIQQSGHVSVLDKLENSGSGLYIYNLGVGRGISVLELVHTFEKVNGVKVNYRIAPRRPGDIAENFADSSKAYRELGWKTEKTVEDMCRDSWNFMKKEINQ